MNDIEQLYQCILHTLLIIVTICHIITIKIPFFVLFPRQASRVSQSPFPFAIPIWTSKHEVYPMSIFLCFWHTNKHFDHVSCHHDSYFSCYSSTKTGSKSLRVEKWKIWKTLLGEIWVSKVSKFVHSINIMMSNDPIGKVFPRILKFVDF